MKRFALPVCIATGLLLSASAARAVAIFNLVIDVTNPAAVTFTATSDGAVSTHSAPVDFSGGITLENFFPSAQSILGGAVVSGNLTARGTSSAYNELVTFNYNANTGNVESGDDLSVYYSVLNASNVQSFVTGQTAFTGSSTVDFTGYTLPAAGASGAINVGFKASQGGAIGYWRVVASAPIPEPSTYALLAGVATLGVVVVRRRKVCR